MIHLQSISIIEFVFVYLLIGTLVQWFCGLFLTVFFSHDVWKVTCRCGSLLPFVGVGSGPQIDHQMIRLRPEWVRITLPFCAEVLATFSEDFFFGPAGNIVKWRVSTEQKTLSDFYWLKTPALWWWQRGDTVGRVPRLFRDPVRRRLVGLSSRICEYLTFFLVWG